METTTEALPPIASLSFADGRVIDVHGGPLVLGRSPRAVRIDGASIPRLVPLEAAGPAVSRAHARIDVIAGRLSIEDLDSRNGTAVIDPIGGSRRLRPGERVPLVDGMVVTIAQDLAFRVIAS
jgi:pSer/pThr/pTyr-binding forkhead associated (FHA) protein